MILESKSGYGPKTKLIERQLDDIMNKRNLLQLESKKLSEYQKSELISADSRTGIIKNLQAFINFNNHNIIGWLVWGVFFLFFLFIELMCLIYKFSSDITSFERKKENFPHKLTVISSTEIKHILEYVEMKYGKNFISLYENKNISEE